MNRWNPAKRSASFIIIQKVPPVHKHFHQLPCKNELNLLCPSFIPAMAAFREALPFILKSPEPSVNFHEPLNDNRQIMQVRTVYKTEGIANDNR
jgi:hypothetical protein